jgi:hypothetical protein
MNDMGKSWVVMGRFKLKDWEIYGDYDNCAKLKHRNCGHLQIDIDYKTLPEILDIIAEHECPDES